ncbi:MAG: hypothetical protein JWP01_3079 [Myxococcales bacterium]|nr:hypothetical protein [Myxococcales bacterium]
MTRVLLTVGLAAALATGCSKERIAECDDFVTTAEKAALCTTIASDKRGQFAVAAKQIKDALQKLDDAGGADKAPEATVEDMRRTCKSQNTLVVDELQKTSADCLK